MSHPTPRPNAGPVSMTVPQLRRHECTIGGVVTHLTPVEVDLLAALLVSHPAFLVSYADLIDAVWPDPDRQPLTAHKELSVMVARLRDKGVIITVEHGQGMRVPQSSRGAWHAAPPQRCQTCQQRLAA